jgi:sugar lactone lactonase YvrE
MEQITELKGKLLEGCIWNRHDKALYFVDIDKKRIYQYQPENRRLTYIQVHDYVSCIVPTNENDLVAAIRDGLYRVNFSENHYEKIMNIALDSSLRFNDGKCDKNGNFWLGSMLINQDDFQDKSRGSFYCIQNNRIVQEYTNYTIPNGLAWDEKRDAFYHIDTAKKTVDSYTVVNETQIIKRDICLDFSDSIGAPDGMCIDSEGNLWIALWGAGQVVCYDPVSKQKLHSFSLPRKNVSCCTFGGPNMNLLYVTTAGSQTESGEVYMFETHVKGGEVYPYVYEA